MFLKYLKKLLHKWVAYLVILPTVGDLSETYLEVSLPSMASTVLYLLAFLAFVFATYQVWNDMRVEKEALDEKLKNPVDYEVKAYAKKVVFDIEYLENKIDENIEEAQNIIEASSKELDKLQEKPNENSLSPKLEILRSMQSLGIYENDNHERNKVFYMADLSKYIDELKNFPSKKEECLGKYKDTIENELKDLYMVDFVLTNTGIKSDEDIDVVLNFKECSKYVEQEYIWTNIPKCDTLPVKPKRKSIREVEFIRPTFEVPDFRDIQEMKINANPQTYKRYEKLEEKRFSIKLRDLKVSRSVSIFKDDSYLMKIEDKKSIKCIITSKNSTSKIVKEVVFEDDGEFEWFKQTNKEAENEQ